MLIYSNLEEFYERLESLIYIANEKEKTVTVLKKLSETAV